jgi:hypothetical protein
MKVLEAKKREAAMVWYQLFGKGCGICTQITTTKIHVGRDLSLLNRTGLSSSNQENASTLKSCIYVLPACQFPLSPLGWYHI